MMWTTEKLAIINLNGIIEKTEAIVEAISPEYSVIFVID